MTGSEDGALRHDTVFLSLMPPTPRDHRLALVLIAISTAIFLAIAPFAKVPLAPVPAFIPAYQAALFISDLITAAVLFGQYSIQRTRALLFLACAYLFTALIIVPHTLSFPGVFAPGGLLGAGPETTSWFYICWHAGFPLLVLGYALARRDDTPIAAPRAALMASIAAVVILVVVITLLLTAGQGLLPAILENNRYTPFARGFMPAVCGLSVLALVVLWWHRPHTVLDLWMMVVMMAWVFEVGIITMLIGGRYDLGFYGGRVYGLFTATFVMLMLLLETRALYVRLAQTLARERAAALDRADAAGRAQHESAETLRAVIDGSSQAIVALAPDRTVLLWNRTAVAMFGYTAGEVVGRPYPLMPSEAEAEAEQSALFARVAAGEVLRDQRFRCRRKDGRLPDIVGSAAPFYDATGALRGIACGFEDVTERRAIEEMLRQSQKVEAIGQLTGGVAHDFNNILMVIMANVEAMQDEPGLTPELRDRIERVAASGERASELTRRLLAFSRKQHLNPQRTNLADLVTGTGKLLRRTLGEQIEIDAVLAEDLWTTDIDRGQLEAALINLCVNARDAMPGGGRLLIETSNTELDETYAMQNPGVAAGKYVMLAVSDTGGGIPPELLDKVFEPFFTTKEPGKGTGLGLSMVYGFIKQSNGHIKIYSEPGHGTTIRMYLPRTEAAATAADHKPAAAVAPPRGSEHVLLVEDDPQVGHILLDQLRGLGYAATHAANGQAALDLLDGGQAFDVMLTDIIMPGGIDGRRLAGMASERRPGMKLLFMSGYSENAAINHDHIQAGARLLAKPFRKIELAKAIREALDEPP